MNSDWSADAVLLRLDGPPRRVVSLVPSYTQSFFDLGFGSAIVGITDYCSHPAQKLHGITRIGGPHDFRVDAIRALSPDLVLANQEENGREGVLALMAAGLNVWLSFPQTVKELFFVLAEMVRMVGDGTAATRLRMLESSFEWAALGAQQPAVRFFCPIWQDRGPDGELFWMTFNRETYSSDLLTQLGGENIFAARTRRYPLGADLGKTPAEESSGRDTRYPRVRRDEVLAQQPEIILLPDEPFVFDAEAEEKICEQLAETPAVRKGRVYRFDGRWVTWCGTAIGEAIAELPDILAGSMEEKP
jgi:iron complex transport system substrate-binding protein